MTRLLVVTAVLVATAGCGGHTERAGGPPAPRPSATDGSRFAGTPTSQTYPFRPTTLTLPSGSDADVSAVGVDGAGTLAVPPDPAEVGWWTGGALVGEPFGSVVIAGHVDSQDFGLGVFVELLDIPVGSEIVLGEGSERRTYRVTSVEAVPKLRLAADSGAFRQDVDHRVVLITCGGEFDAQTQSYADNVVVVAEPVE